MKKKWTIEELTAKRDKAIFETGAGTKNLPTFGDVKKLRAQFKVKKAVYTIETEREETEYYCIKLELDTPQALNCKCKYRTDNKQIEIELNGEKIETEKFIYALIESGVELTEEEMEVLSKQMITKEKALTFTKTFFEIKAVEWTLNQIKKQMEFVSLESDNVEEYGEVLPQYILELKIDGEKSKKKLSLMPPIGFSRVRKDLIYSEKSTKKFVEKENKIWEQLKLPEVTFFTNYKNGKTTQFRLRTILTIRLLLEFVLKDKTVELKKMFDNDMSELFKVLEKENPVS